MELANDLPGLFRRFRVGDQVQILVGDHALVRQELEINDPFPVLAAKKQDRNLLHPVRLSQCQRVE